MNNPNFKELLGLPDRTPKPRETGLTHVLEKGMGLSGVEDFLKISSTHIDIVKLGWGTSLVTPMLKEKIRIYRDHNIPVCLGGTLLEKFISSKKFEDYVSWVRDLGLTHIEISDGVISLPHDIKLSYIKRLSKEFTVLSEIGSKDENIETPPYKWIEMALSELEAGAWKVIGEARESGTAGLFRDTGAIRSGLIEEVVTKIGPESWIFEAPQKSQQVWFIQRFGPNVNLGNIAPAEVIPLETLRLGLRADTLVSEE